MAIESVHEFVERPVLLEQIPLLLLNPLLECENTL